MAFDFNFEGLLWSKRRLLFRRKLWNTGSIVAGALQHISGAGRISKMVMVGAGVVARTLRLSGQEPARGLWGLG